MTNYIDNLIAENRGNIIKSESYESFIKEFMPEFIGYKWIEGFYNSYKNNPEIEYFAKQLYFSEHKKFSDLFDCVKTFTPSNAEGRYYLSDGFRGKPLLKCSNGGFSSYYAKPKPFLDKFLKDCLCDDRDSISLELIDWAEYGWLLVASNSLIIGSRWITILKSED